MAGASVKIVCSLGVERIVCRIVRRTILLREALAAEPETLFHWQNAPEVRSSSFYTEPIAWEGHTDWCGATLMNLNRVFLVVIENNSTIGLLGY